MSVPKLIFIAGLAALFISSVVAYKSLSNQDLKVNDHKFKYTVADSEEERVRGLSGRDSLPDDEVLVFAFEESNGHGIWMKDMKFPIDIIWLDEDKKVVDIEMNVSPDSYPKSFESDIPAIYVVEANAGIATKIGLKLSHQFEFETAD